MKAWPERFPEQAAAAETYWCERGFEMSAGDTGAIDYEGVVRSVVRGIDRHQEPRDYRIRIRYPPGYPSDPPRVTFLDPKIEDARHMAHGQPCLFDPRDWTFDVSPEALHRQVVRWLRGHRTGNWQGEIPVYELPAYYDPAEPAVLIAEGTLAAIDSSDAGDLSIQRFRDPGIAVLNTISGTTVGDELLDGLELLRHRPLNGPWFRLTTEPPPIRNTTQLASLLTADGHTWTSSRTPWKPKLVSLVFDDDTGRTRLLVMRYQAKRGVPRPIPEGWPLDALETHTVSREEMFKRIDAVRDLTALDDTQVTIFGLGAIGSAVADLLVREGIGAFRLLDPDRLKPGNLVRHTLDLRATGQWKAEAVARSLYRINPTCEIETEASRSVLMDPQQIDRQLAGSNAAILAIGDDVIEELVSDVAVSEDRDVPALVVRTVHAGHVVRIMRIRRGRDPCMHCLRLHRQDEHPDWIEIPTPPHPPIYDEGCANPSPPGAGLASRDAANNVTRRLLEMLGSLQANDPQTNHWVTVLEPIADAEDPRLRQTGTHALALPLHPDCPRCR